MIPVTQDLFGPIEGNCTAACIASILEMPLRSVPNVGVFADFNLRINWWLRRRGLCLVTIGWDEGYVRRFLPDAFIIAGGQAARGIGHAVVYRGATLAHDPHPSRAGLVSSPEEISVIGIGDLAALYARRAA